MFKWLLPKETDFFQIFDEHIAIVAQGAEQLSSLMHSPPFTPEMSQQIKELEKKADRITHRCVEELHRTFITPFQRDDIYHLISKMDDIMDFVEDISSRLLIYKLSTMPEEAHAFASLLQKSTSELVKAFGYMHNLKNSADLKQSFVYIHQIESEADSLYIKTIGKLFDEMEDIRTLIKWKEIYEEFETAIDCCEDVANIIEGVILESS